MTKQEPNPYAYGYARMPRIIRKGYKNLTNMQKLLYIYLRDLCGEDGTCYRSLRSLKDETGFSIGYLSVAIPVLHNEGLIHAEMRKTSSTHWEVWHISVIDIWEKNAAFLQAEKAKCSPDEQMNEQSVQDMNRSVHQMNKIAESVHEVNESVHAMILNKNHTNNQLTENKDREESIVVSAVAENDAPAFAFQIADFPHYYHDFCFHQQDQGVNDGLQALVKPISQVPQGKECQICYKPIHGPHGYFEIGIIDFKKATDGRMKAVSPSHSQCLSEEETVKMPAIPKQTPAAGVPAIPPHGSDASAQALSGSPSGVDAAQRTATDTPDIPSISGRGAVQASIPKRPRGKVTQATLKTPEELALDERCRALQQRINDWRGYPLEGKGQIINERKSIRTLVERYSDERIERDYLYLFNRHWKWSKPDNRYHIGAYVILSEAESIEQELKAKQSPNGNIKRDENIGVSGLPRLKPLGEVKYG